MEITIIAETSGEGIHPVTEQLVGAASSLGGCLLYTSDAADE